MMTARAPEIDSLPSSKEMFCLIASYIVCVGQVVRDTATNKIPVMPDRVATLLD